MVEKNKLIGLILSIAGLAVLAITLGLGKFIGYEKIPLLSDLSSKYVLVASLALIIIGVIMLKTSSTNQKTKEVPIYKGKEIVGYRRE